jgi:hypothetical protein
MSKPFNLRRPDHRPRLGEADPTSLFEMFKVRTTQANGLHVVATLDHNHLLGPNRILKDHGQSQGSAERGYHPSFTFRKKELQVVRTREGNLASELGGEGGKVNFAVRWQKSKEFPVGAFQNEAFHHAMALGLQVLGAPLGRIGGWMIKDLMIDMRFLKPFEDS